MSQLSQDTARNIMGAIGASDAEIERLVQQKGLDAPRVTLEALLANIRQVEYTRTVTAGGQVLRWCVITTLSGFAVTGRPSVAVSPENDDAEVGERVAFENAKNELWPLMGYALKERLALLDARVARFLSWPLPADVAADGCATDPASPHPRHGTSLLTAGQARAMLEHVLA